MIKFKQKKAEQEFTYRGHILKAEIWEKFPLFRCYHCGIKNLYKRENCDVVHKCKCKDGKYLFFKHLGKFSKK